MKKTTITLLTALQLLCLGCATDLGFHDIPLRLEQPDDACVATSMVHAITGEPNPLHLPRPYDLVVELDDGFLRKNLIFAVADAKRLGYIKDWKYVTSTEEMIEALKTSTVLLSVPLYEEMYLNPPFRHIRGQYVDETLSIIRETERRPMALWRPGGKLLGRHAALVNGYWERYETFNVVNTWGVSWGHRGEVMIERDDMDAFFRDDARAIQIIK